MLPGMVMEDAHGDEAWYADPAMYHYRYYWVWVWKTSVERIINTLAWFPTYLVMLITSSSG